MTEKVQEVSTALGSLITLSKILRRSGLNTQEVFTLKVPSTVWQNLDWKRQCLLQTPRGRLLTQTSEHQSMRLRYKQSNNNSVKYCEQCEIQCEVLHSLRSSMLQSLSLYQASSVIWQQMVFSEDTVSFWRDSILQDQFSLKFWH